MSICNIQVAMSRIESAEPRSPIAVFRTKGEDGQVNAMFASTVMTQRMLNTSAGKENLIGVFDKTMPKSIVRQQIKDGAKSVFDDLEFGA